MGAGKMEGNAFIIGPDDPILVTGAGGFIGQRVVRQLLDYGFRKLRCFIRASADPGRVNALSALCPESASMEIIHGNLLQREDCAAAAKGAAVIFHLAAGRGEKSFSDAFLNSVVTTRNLLEESARCKSLRRFVTVSSFAVYTNRRKSRREPLDESSPVEDSPELRGEPYCFAKVKQDEIVREYGQKFAVPYVIVRPGYVYGPGNEAISGRVGIGTFGIFLHLGGSNTIPFTYVDNCSEAIVLAGLKYGVEGEVFNVVDDDLPSSRHFLRLYKRYVGDFRSVYIPHIVSYMLCVLWERYCAWSKGQLPPAFNRLRWHANWSKTNYSNAKLKSRLGWAPKVSTPNGLARYFEACRNRGRRA
jgi:nucleoside-diphosphate-sugar epimerase